MYLHLSGSNSTIDTTNEFSFNNIVILKGDHTNTPLSELPYGEGIYSVGENEVTEDGKYKISGKSCGKNLFDSKNKTIFNKNGITITPTDDGCYIVNGTATAQTSYMVNTVDGAVLNTFDLSKNKTYILSDGVNSSNNTYFMQLACKGKETSVMHYYVTNGGKYKLTPTENLSCRYLIIVREGATLDNALFKPMIEETPSTETTPTDYEPYQESTYSYLLNEPLRSLPNGVADTIEENKVVRRVRKVVLDGSEDWVCNDQWAGEKVNTVIFRVLKPDIARRVYDSIICDRFYCNNNLWGHDEEGVYCTENSIDIRITRAKLGITEEETNTTTKITKFKTWLSSNNLIVYYQLAESVITELDKTLQLKTFDGLTNIMSDNYLIPTVSAKIPSDVQAVVSSLITENKELTEEVSTLSVENEELKQTNEIQDELIDINMCATDEMYVLLEPLLAQSISTMSLEREVSKMVDLYVAMIQRGLKTIDEVPIRYREQVKEVLAQLEK